MLRQLSVGLMTHIHTISRQLAVHRAWQPRPTAGKDVDHFNLIALNSFQETSQKFSDRSGKGQPPS